MVEFWWFLYNTFIVNTSMNRLVQSSVILCIKLINTQITTLDLKGGGGLDFIFIWPGLFYVQALQTFLFSLQFKVSCTVLFCLFWDCSYSFMMCLYFYTVLFFFLIICGLCIYLCACWDMVLQCLCMFVNLRMCTSCKMNYLSNVW